MNTTYDMSQNDRQIVYVKAVDVADLPEEVQASAGEYGTLYSVHNENGQRLALVADRKLAFTLARQHDMAPVAVH